MSSKILYISYDGLTDPLGQSQILPYLTGLSNKGYRITIISCEKKNSSAGEKIKVKKILSDNNIEWYPCSYTKKPAVISTIIDTLKMRRIAHSLQKKENFSIVHCRSYIASLVGLRMKKKYKIKFIFDMRGFWADERVDGGLWNLENPLYRLIYNYFKKKEREFLKYADYTVSLTMKARKIIHGWADIPNQPIPIEVIPCCVDIQRFSREKINQKKLLEIRNKLGITETDFILSYLGSIGTWYLLDEMLDFFKYLLLKKPGAKFLFITEENQSFILNAANKANIPSEKILVAKSIYEEVASYLALSSISIFFIKPCFSKNASSPTKQAEVLSLGIPVICNSSIGDSDKIILDNKCGIIIEKFMKKDYMDAIEKINDCLKIPRENIRNTAIKHFSLEKGNEQYEYIYKTLQK